MQLNSLKRSLVMLISVVTLNSYAATQDLHKDEKQNWGVQQAYWIWTNFRKLWTADKNLTDLPLELLEKIYAYLDPESRKEFTQVNKKIASVRALTSLSLTLVYNKLHGKLTFPFRNIKSLSAKNLSLIQVAEAEYIFLWAKELPFLEQLEIHNSDLIPIFDKLGIEDLRNLRILKICGCRIDTLELRFLMKSLNGFTHPHLEVLDLRGSNIRDDDGTQLYLNLLVDRYPFLLA